MLAKSLDLLAFLLCCIAAPLLLLGEWLRDMADALRYREAVLERIDMYATFDTFD